MSDLMEQLKNLQSLDLDQGKAQEIRSRMLDTYISSHSRTSFLSRIFAGKFFKYWEPVFITVVTIALGFDLFQIIRFLHGM